MSILGYRAKRLSIFAVCLLTLLAVSGTIFIKGITPPSPTGTWAAAGNGLGLSSPRAGAASVQLQDGRILITGGDDGSGAVATADIYDTLGNFSAAASMNVARSKHTATLLQDGTVLVAGGLSSGVATTSAEIYNPSTNTWTATTGSLISARSGHTATALPDGTVLIAGGDNAGTPLSSLEIYDPTSGTFSTVAGSLSSPREQHAAAALHSGDVIIVGGFNGMAALGTSDLYTFSTGKVGPGPVMSTPRQELSATTQLDGNVLIAGGNNGSANGSQDLATAEVYSESTGTFSLTGSLATPRQGHQAFLLPHNGSILIVGGTTPVSGVETATSSVEMYYPLGSGTDANPNWNGTFNSTGTMASPRVSATGSPLSNGTPSSLNDGILLVAGGKDASGSTLASGELYGFAWVKTDATDYAPGTTVHITGGGWQPGETVTLHFQESPYFDTHPDLTAVADSNGNISHDQFSPDSHDFDIQFYLSASGSASGSQAQTVFTDAGAANLTITASPSTAIGGTFNLSATNNGGNPLNLTNQSTPLNNEGTKAGTNFTISSIAAHNGCTWNGTIGSGTTGGGSASSNGTTVTGTEANAQQTLTVTLNYNCTATHFAVSAPSSATAGTGFNFTVTALDVDNNVVPGYTGTVKFTSTDGQAVLPANYTFVAGDNGAHTFSATLNTAGNQTITAKDTVTSSITGTSGTIAVSAGTPSSITATAGTPQSTTIDTVFATKLAATVKDTFNNPVSGVTVTFTPPGSGASGTFTGGNTAITNASGVATANTFTANGTAGSYTVTGSVTGVSTPASFSLTNNQATSSTSVSSSVNPSVFGQSVTFTATVAPGSGSTAPTGTVQFVIDGSNFGSAVTLSASGSNGVASVSDGALAVGNHTVAANYSGDSNFKTSTGTLTGGQTVNKAATTTTIPNSSSLSATPTVVGQGEIVDFSVTVNSPGTGTVSPTDTVTVSDGTSSCTAAVSAGNCVLTYTSAGAKTVTAKYNGDTNFAVSTSTGVSHTVNQAATTTTITNASSLGTASIVGQAYAVNYSVAVNSPGSGTIPGTEIVTVSDGTSTCSGTVTAGTCNLTSTTPGSKTITAAYTGDTNFAASTSTGVSHTVNSPATATAVTSNPNPSAYGQPVTFTATVTSGGGTPTGSVTFVAGSSCPGTALTGSTNPATLSGGVATFTTSALPAGTQTITACYSPTGIFTASNGSVSQTVSAAATSISISAPTVTYPANGVVRVTVSSTAGTPTGNVSLTVDGTTTQFAVLDLTGTATFTLTSSAGIHNLSASYAAQGNFAASSTTGTLTVNAAATSISINAPTVVSPANGVVRVTVSSTAATPTGNVSLTVDGTTTQFAFLDVTGAATFTLASPSVGIHNLSASYAAQGNFAASSTTGTLTVDLAPSITNNASTTFTAAEAGTFTVTTMGFPAPGLSETGALPSGVTFTDNGNGTATLAGTTTVAGNYPITITATNGVGTPAQQAFTLMVSAGSFTQLQILVPGETAAPGTTSGKTGTPNIEYVNGQFPVTVNAVDANWNVVSSVTDTAHLASTDTSAILPTDAALVSGTGTFNVTLETTENTPTTTVTATDASNVANNTSISPDTSPKLEVIVVYTAAITPTMVATGQATTYTLTISNAAAPNTNNLASATIAVPTADQGTTITGVSVSATTQPGNAAVNWTYDASQLPGMMRFSANTGSDAVAPGGTITITFTATSSAAVNSSPIQEVWNTVAFSDSKWTTPLPLAPPEPTVSVGVGPTFTSAATTTFTYGSPGSYTVTTNGVPTNKLTESGAPAWVTFTDNGDDTATISGTPTAAGNYPITITAHNGFGIDATQNFTLTVSGAALTITASSGSMTYGGTVFSVTPSFSGFVNGDTYKSLTTQPTCTTTATSSSPVSGSPYTSSCSGAVDPNYTITYVSGTVTVNPAALTITASSGSMTYGGPVFSVTPSFSGFVTGDTYKSLTTHPTCSTTATSFSAVAGSPYVTSCSGAVDSNYTITYVPGTVTVNPAALTISADNQSMTFGGTTPTFTATYTGLLGADTSAVVSGLTFTVYTDNTLSTPVTDFQTLKAGSYPIVASGGVAANYAIQYVNGTLTVNKATFTGSVTISPADPNTVPYGQPVTATVLLNSYSIGGVPVLQPHADPNNPNQQLPESLTVYLVPAGGGPSQAMKFGTATAVPAYDNTASTTGTTKTGWTATITGKAPTPGNYTAFVYGDDPGDGSLTNLNLADSGYFYADTADIIYPTLQSKQLDVVPAALTITANDQSKTYGQTVTFAGTEFSTSGLVNNDTVTSVTLTSAGAAATATVAGSPYPIVPSAAVGSGLSNYSITYVNGKLTVKQAMVTPSIMASNKAFDGTTAATVTCTLSGVVNSDSVTCSPASANFSQSNAGNGLTVTATGITLSGPAAPNYSLTSTTATTTANITPAPTTTTVISNPNPSTYGQTITFTAFVNNTGSQAVPTGTVSFTIDGTPVGGTVEKCPSAIPAARLCATYSTSALMVSGSPHSVSANYTNVDGNFQSGSGALAGGQTVNKATTTTMISLTTPIFYGQSTMVSATVSPEYTGTPGGSVTVTDSLNPSDSCVITLSGGSGSCSLMPGAAGALTVTGSYGGDTNFQTSAAMTPLAVNPDSTSVAVSPANAIFGDANVTLSATVTNTTIGSIPVNGGSVTFNVNGNPVGSGNVSGGSASYVYPLAGVNAGSYTITASYSGATDFGSSNTTTSANLSIQKADTTTSVAVSPGSTTLGDAVTLSANVADASGGSAGTPTGLVTFFDGSTPVGNGILSGGTATFTTSVLSVGSHTISAAYDGDANFNATGTDAGSTFTGPASETVALRSTSVGVSLNPTTVVVGQLSKITVTVTDNGTTNPPGTADTFRATGAPGTGTTGATSTLFGDGLVLVAGGLNSSGRAAVTNAYIYSAGTFTATGNLNSARTGATATLLPNGKILVAGGSSDGTAGGALNTAELFDPAVGTFAVAGNGSSKAMTAARFGATATLLPNGQVLIAGGENSGGVVGSAELYNSATDTFTATGSLAAPRYDAAATLFGNGKVLIAGGTGAGSAVLNSAELYDPAATTFASTGSLTTQRTGATATLLLNGSVLVAGGSSDGTTALSSAELYASGTFTPSSSNLNTARFNGTATGLPNGMVLLVGGANGSTAELYDPDSDKFDSTGILVNSDQANLTATLLNNGDVLITGLTSGGSPAADAELYAPSFNPLGTAALSSSEATDSFSGTCVLTPSTATASTCDPTVTPANVATSTHTITGTYSADAMHSSSSGNAPLTVQPAPTSTTVTPSQNPSTFGQSVTFTATVVNTAGAGVSTATPTGSVQFYIDGVAFGSHITLTGSGASVTVTSGAITTLSTSGSPHNVTATYNNTDGNFLGSNNNATPLSQVVQPAPSLTTVTSSLSPSSFGQSVTFTATVANAAGAGVSTATPTGSVQFYIDGTAFGAPVPLTGTGASVTATSGAVTTLSVSGSPHTIKAAYTNTDGNFVAGNGTTSQTANAATTSTSVVSNPNPSIYGQAVTFTAFVTNTTPSSPAVPTGTVSFSIDGGAPIAGTPEVCPSAIPANRMCAKFSTSAITVTGSPHSVSATYTNSDGNFASGGGALTGGQTVTPAPLIITASSAAMIYGTPVPPITPSFAAFVNNETFSNLSTQPACGTAATSASPVGTYASSCTGAADPNYAISYVPGSVSVTQASTATSVVSSQNPSIYLQSVTFTATVADATTGSNGTPTGTVQFSIDGIAYGSPVSVAACSLSVANAVCAITSTASLTGTTHIILASYSGDPNFVSSSGTLANGQTVIPAPVVNVSVPSMSFTGQNVGSTSSPIPVTVANIGDATLNFGGISIIGADSGEFAIQSTTCVSTLGYPGESGNPPTSCTINVTFTPKDTGEAFATVQITDNNDNVVGSQQNVTLTGGGLSTLSAVGTLYTDAAFATANTCGSLTLSGGSTVDSFNSSQGYGSSHQLSGGNVGTNGNVTLNGSKSAIYGSASVLSMQSGNCSKSSVTGLTSSGGAQVTGGLTQLGGPVSYPTPSVPNPAPPTTSANASHSCPSGMTGCTNTANNTISLAPGSYGNLQLSGGTTADLSTGTYNFNSLALSGKSVLYVSSGPVIINIAGAGLSGGAAALDLSGGTIVNQTGIPSKLQFFYGGARGVNLSGGAQAYATVYAPTAPINMSGGTDFFGGIIGLTITDSGGTAFHGDNNLSNVQGGNFIWLTAVVNNVQSKNKPLTSAAGQVKLYLTNSSISFAATSTRCSGMGGTFTSPSSCALPVPNAVVTLNSASATASKTSYDMTNNRWITSVPPSSLTGNTFVTGVAIPVPAGFPSGIQNINWSTAFSTDTPNLTFQWQWSAGVYSSFSTTYAQSGNTNMLGVNPEDGSADAYGLDPAGTPENFKQDEVIGFFSAPAAVAAAAAEMSTAPSNLAFTSSGQAMVSVLTNNDGVTHNISGFSKSGTNASDFVLQPSSPGTPNSCVGVTSLAAGVSCNLYVVFTSTAAGPESARIVVNDDANNNPQSVYLTGP